MIGVPDRESFARAIQWPRRIAEPEEMVIVRGLLVDAKAPAMTHDGFRIPLEHMAVQVAHGEGETGTDIHVQFPCRKAVRFRGDGYRATQGCRQDGPGRVFRLLAVQPNTHP